eukprot:scaffold18508_cov37-Attheya_sp.AAC.2
MIIHDPVFHPASLDHRATVFLLGYKNTLLSDPWLMALNSLASQQNKGTEHTAKQITHFLNYCATHPHASITFVKSNMILHFYSDASYLSEPEAHSRYGGYFFFSPKSDKPITHMPDLNKPIHVECSIMQNILASAMEATMEGLLNNCQKGAQLHTTAFEMKHPQPPNPVATDNSEAESVLNGTAKQKQSRAIDMHFYWVRDRTRQGQFHKTPPRNFSNQAMHPILLHPTAQDLLNAQGKSLHYQRGCAGTGTGLRSRMTSSAYQF